MGESHVRLRTDFNETSYLDREVKNVSDQRFARHGG